MEALLEAARRAGKPLEYREETARQLRSDLGNQLDSEQLPPGTEERLIAALIQQAKAIEEDPGLYASLKAFNRAKLQERRNERN